MKKYAHFICILLLINLAVKVNAQGGWLNPNPGAYGTISKRASFDSTLLVPTGCGQPTSLKAYDLRKGAFFVDTCNYLVWWYNPSSLSWDTLNKVGGGGGGGDNNYTTGITFSNNVLTLTRSGLSNLSASWDSTKYHSMGFYDGRYYPLGSNPAGYLVAADISGKLNISDTAAMLANYFNQVGWGLNKSGHVVSADSSKVATKWKIDSLGALIAGGGDGNNYTTSASFTDATLTLGRSGLSNLTATFDTTRWHTKFYYDGLYQPIGSYLTGNQTITLSGDVSGSGATSITTTIGSNKVTDGMLRQSAGLSVIGRASNSTGNVADITAGSDNYVLRRNGTTLAFGTIDSTSVPDLHSENYYNTRYLIANSRTINTNFPVKGGGDLSSNRTISLFPKVTQQQSVVTANSNPYSPELQWDTLTTNQLPHYYDGTSFCYNGDTLFKVNGWYTGASAYTTDSIYYSVPPYNTWSLWPVRFPYKGHSISYHYNQARGYWMFCGSDGYGTNTDRKTVITTVDFRTFTTATADYGGAERLLGSSWADDNGVNFWGFGQSTNDSANHLDDIYSDGGTDGATWTQIASGINVGGFTLGGNDANQFKYRNGYVYGIGVGGKYDDNSAKRTYSKRNFYAKADDLTKWWELDTIPITNAKQFPLVALFNGWIFYINGHNGISNTAEVAYLDLQDKWHKFNIGGIGSVPSLSISHAQGGGEYKDRLFIMQGNDNNTAYVLKRGKVEYPETYKQFHGDIYIGGSTDGNNLRLNTSVGSEASNTFAEFNAKSSSRSETVKITSDNFCPLNISSQTISNLATLYGANNQWYFGAGHSASGSGTANSYLVYQAGTNYFPFAIKPNGKFVLNNNSGTVPTPHNTSVGRFVGLRDTTSAGTNLGRIVADANGDLWRDTATLSVGSGGISVVSDVDYSDNSVRGAISNDTLFINTFNGNNTGLVPMPDNITGKYLKDDGTWDAPSGSGDMILSATQSVTGLKTFDKDKLAMKGTSTGVTTISTANTGSSNYTATLQAANGTIAYLSDITGTNSGTNTGDVTLSSEHDLVLTGQALRTNKTPLSLTDGGTISWDRNNGFNAYVTLGGNRTLAFSNEQAGDYGTLVVVQDGTGGRTLAVPDGTVTLNNAAGDTTVLSYYYDGNVHYWKDGSVNGGGGGATNLDGLTDVTITSATTGDYLRYNGSAWVNAATTNITTLGTIGTGTWQGSVISSTYGGTGVNNAGRTLTINSNSGTIAFSAASKTLTVAKSLTLDGTDGTTMTFPSTSATIARTDAAQTFTGTQTFSSAPAISSISNTGTLTLPTVTSTIMGYKEASISSNATWSPDGDARENYYDITAQAAAVTTINAPSGTPANHNTLLIRVKDNGTARSISGWNAIYRAGTNLSLPTTTTISKTMYIKFIYNSTDSKWDLISVLDGL
jgi:hypothetical protein